MRVVSMAFLALDGVRSAGKRTQLDRSPACTSFVEGLELVHLLVAFEGRRAGFVFLMHAVHNIGWNGSRMLWCQVADSALVGTGVRRRFCSKKYGS